MILIINLVVMIGKQQRSSPIFQASLQRDQTVRATAVVVDVVFLAVVVAAAADAAAVASPAGCGKTRCIGNARQPERKV